jgi:excisionase family DNA binding protein
MVDTSEFLFIDEIARKFRVPASTVRHWIATGKLRSVRPGRRRLIHRDDLKSFCDSFAPAASARAQG